MLQVALKSAEKASPASRLEPHSPASPGGGYSPPASILPRMQASASEELGATSLHRHNHWRRDSHDGHGGEDGVGAMASTANGHFGSSSRVHPSNDSLSPHLFDHLKSDLKRIQGNIQGQIDTLTLKMNEGRLNDQRARHRDRELIMQAIFKQRDDTNQRITECKTEAVEMATKVAEGAITAAFESENAKREKIQEEHMLQQEAIMKTAKVCLVDL